MIRFDRLEHIAARAPRDRADGPGERMTLGGEPDVVVGILMAKRPGAGTACLGTQPAGRVTSPLSVRDERSLDRLLHAAGVEHVVLAGIRLEKYQWPERVVEVEDFPRRPSGRVRKQALRSGVSA